MGNLILMIDSNIDESRKLKINLENLGYKVLISKNIEEAPLIINANKVDVIMIFDFDFDFKKLHSNKLFQGIPVIAVFDISLKDKLDSIIEYIDDYFTKPYDKDQVYQKIKTQIKIKSLQDLLKEKDNEINKAYKQLEEFSLIDKSTGLYNEFYLRHIIANECANAKRYRYKLSGLAFKIDSSGGNIDDVVTREVVDIVRDITRINDIFVRLDSGEFYILLINTGIKDALFVAQKIKSQLQSHVFKDNMLFNISIGVTSLDEIDRGLKKEVEMIKRAKEALDAASCSEDNNIEFR